MATHDISTLELYRVDRGTPDDREVSPVQCLPPRLRRLTVLDRTHVIAAGDSVHDRGVVMRVVGRAPWAERVTESVGVPGWTMVAVQS